MTNNTKASKYFRERLEEFHYLLDGGDDLFCIIDANYCYVWANRAYLDVYGLQLEEIEERTVEDVVGAEYFRQTIKPRIDRCFAGEAQHYETEWNYAGLGLRKLLVRYYPIDLPHKPNTLLGAVITDVTEIRARDQELRKLAHITEQSPSPVAVTDLEGRIEYVNPAFERISGYSREELLGNTPASIQSGHTPETAYQELWETITAGKVWTGELQNRRKDGTLYWESEVISPLKDESGRITNYVAIKQDITALKEAEQALNRIAFEDPLTGLFNFVGFTRKMQKHIDQHGWPVTGALVTFNIARLRDINDAYGHEAGDWLLSRFGRRLKDLPGEQILAGRIGGDEFTLFILPAHGEALELYLNRLVESLSLPFQLASVNIEIELRLGYTRLGKRQRPIEDLLRESERALSLHRQDTSVPWVAYSKRIQKETQKRIELARELRLALAEDQFELHFQPKVDLATGTLIACEALIRWNHPTRGLISPGEFIPIAEQSQMIGPIGDWVLYRACQHLRDWRNAGLQPVRVAVNVSIIQFQRGDFASRVRTALDQSEVAPEELALEVTESVFERESAVLLNQMSVLRDMGVWLSLDDFGTGYSSLLYLQRYPFNEIKIDQGFVFKLLEDPFSRNIVEMVIMLAKALNAEVIAEGIESAEVRNALIEMGCRSGQGFFYSMPLEAEDFRWLLEQRSKLPLTTDPGH
ncbi:putative bifunctional diguanylate cyclase/phosphodiesterase [Nitrincola alkalilacustris]|uniref:putative bifunctional diguanylate cyclase/phosphodiesterase n=1 Tax=Nitrincola alkalilacustris TaxID=1571224 RepID=UPI00124CED72|nr:EAL domain-containing protein [Nitrincola alkalilacustris]